MKIHYTNHFRKTLKKLHLSQKLDLDKAVTEIISNPLLGEQKLGKLVGIRVHKFKMQKQLTLLAYRFFDDELIIELLKLAPHENFYRDLENNM
jgi:mRNA-degrading endonuclease RelE of RelBE toxin-antitoxin system